MELKDLIGKHVLSGVEFGKVGRDEFYSDAPTVVDILLDGKKISFVENPEDGYRSSMKDVILNRKGAKIKNKFIPVDVICVERLNEGYQRDEIIDFIDCVTSKRILSVGTGNTDADYPYFVGQWFPENLCLNQAGQDDGQ